MLAALAFVKGEVGDASASRVAILHNPAATAAGPPSQLQRIVLAAAAVPSRRPKLPGGISSLIQHMPPQRVTVVYAAQLHMGPGRAKTGVVLVLLLPLQLRQYDPSSQQASWRLC